MIENKAQAWSIKVTEELLFSSDRRSSELLRYQRLLRARPPRLRNQFSPLPTPSHGFNDKLTHSSPTYVAPAAGRVSAEEEPDAPRQAGNLSWEPGRGTRLLFVGATMTPPHGRNRTRFVLRNKKTGQRVASSDQRIFSAMTFSHIGEVLPCGHVSITRF